LRELGNGKISMDELLLNNRENFELHLIGRRRDLLWMKDFLLLLERFLLNFIMIISFINENIWLIGVLDVEQH
jgi:hypothetical protein